MHENICLLIVIAASLSGCATSHNDAIETPHGIIVVGSKHYPFVGPRPTMWLLKDGEYEEIDIEGKWYEIFIDRIKHNIPCWLPWRHKVYKAKW